MPRRAGTTILTLSLLAILGLVLVSPIVTVVRQGFILRGGFSLFWVQEVLLDRLYREGLINSVIIACLTTTLCLLISLPLALLANNLDFKGKKWWLALVQVPLIMPPFVGALGLKALLSRNGGINELLAYAGLLDAAEPIDFLASKLWACVILEALYLYPITFLNVQAALANIDPALEEAGANLGAGAWRRFFRITLPLMRPGVFAGSTIVFIWSFTELGTPLMVGFETVTAVQVFRKLETTNPSGDAYALVVFLLTASVGLYLIGKLILGRPLAGMMAKATVASEPIRLGWGKSLLVTLPFALVFCAAVLPHIGVVLNSVCHVGELTLNPANMTLEQHRELVADVAAGRGIAAGSVINSFKYAIIATAVDVVLGFLIAYLVVRRRSWLTGMLDNLAMLPLAVPGLVMAFGYFAMTQPHSIFGGLLSGLNPLHHDPTPLLIVAYATRRLPFMVRSCAAGLEQVSEALEESAINLGAGPLRTVLTITVPLLAANFIAGSLLVFSRSMLEVSDSLILAFDDNTYPMTKAIYDLADLPGSGTETASALGVWGMAILTVTIVGASLALGKRLGALFRA